MQGNTGPRHESAEGTGLGAAASLHLQLQDAERDLAELQARKNDLLAQADVARALACEPGRRTSQRNGQAAHLRLQAFLMDPDVKAARARVLKAQSRLKSAPAHAAPVVFEAGQVEGQDDTMNFRAEVML
jgi:hypothetical protein